VVVVVVVDFVELGDNHYGKAYVAFLLHNVFFVALWSSLFVLDNTCWTNSKKHVLEKPGIGCSTRSRLVWRAAKYKGIERKQNSSGSFLRFEKSLLFYYRNGDL
jgi:hypothetical protein